jgi:hypothetical protein
MIISQIGFDYLSLLSHACSVWETVSLVPILTPLGRTILEVLNCRFRK